jgi:hypothetical protein
VWIDLFDINIFQIFLFFKALIVIIYLWIQYTLVCFKCHTNCEAIFTYLFWLWMKNLLICLFDQGSELMKGVNHFNRGCFILLDTCAMWLMSGVNDQQVMLNPPRHLCCVVNVRCEWLTGDVFVFFLFIIYLILLAYKYNTDIYALIHTFILTSDYLLCKVL